METSKNELAEKIVGKRIITKGTFIFDPPFALDFHCPVCDYELSSDGEYDERLQWSEYNGFIYCNECNKDYPSTLCMPDIDKAIEVYLRTVNDAKSIKL
jgi:transcription elongation factor Elf1